MTKSVNVIIINENFTKAEIHKGNINKNNEFVQKGLFGKPKLIIPVVDKSLGIFINNTETYFFKKSNNSYSQISFEETKTLNNSLIQEYINTYKLSEAEKNSMLDLKRLMRNFEISMIILMLMLSTLIIITYFGINQYTLAFKNNLAYFNKTYGGIVFENHFAIQKLSNETIALIQLDNYTLSALNNTINYLRSHTLR